MEAGSVAEMVLEIVCNQLWVNLNGTKQDLENQDLDIVEDLGACDPDIVEHAKKYRVRFGIKISDEEVRNNTKFSQIVGLIEDLIQRKPSE